MTTNDYAFDQSRRKVFWWNLRGSLCLLWPAGPDGWAISHGKQQHWKRAQFKCLRCELATGQWTAACTCCSCICCCFCCCCWRSMQALMGRVFGCHCRILMYLEIRCWCCCGLHSYSYHVSHWVGPRGLDCAHCSWFLRRLHLNVPRQHSIWNIYTKAFSLRFALI